MSMARRLARLEAAARVVPAVPEPEAERCRRCGGEVRHAEGSEAESILLWQDKELQATLDDLVYNARRLMWCQACQRIVTAGKHDPDWQRQFWERDESLEFQEHLDHCDLLRRLIPCPYHKWCLNRYGKVCESCSGLGRLELLGKTDDAVNDGSSVKY
jgi:hypothetical protein